MRSKTQAEGALKKQLKNAGAASGRGSGTMAALLSFGGVCALPWMLHLNGEEKRLGYSNSILSVFLFCLLFVVLKRALAPGFSREKRRWVLPALFGLLFSGCMVFGAQLDQR